jgi:hypothetical protein
MFSAEVKVGGIYDTYLITVSTFYKGVDFLFNQEL